MNTRERTAQNCSLSVHMQDAPENSSLFSNCKVDPCSGKIRRTGKLFPHAAVRVRAKIKDRVKLRVMVRSTVKIRVGVSYIMTIWIEVGRIFQVRQISHDTGFAVYALLLHG